jgi:hypothetical protein
MVPPETLRAYRAFLEYRLLMALERRAIAYWADATGVLTRALLDLGRHLGYVVSLEKRYRESPAEGGLLRSDVHWQGESAHLWEIDRTVKNASAAKLAAAGEGEKYWVLWAQDNELLSLRFMELQGVNLIIVGHDVRKRVWERLVFEREERSALQAILARESRFASARGLDAASGMPGPGNGAGAEPG